MTSSHRIVLLVGAAALIACTAGVSAASIVPAQADDYLQTARLFHAALESGDGRAAIVRLAEDVTIFEAGGAEMSRTEYAEHHLHGDTQFAAATDRTIVDRQHGRTGEVAWVTSRTETHGTFGEREIHSRGTETMLLRHNGQEWRIFHIHWSSRPIEQ